MIIKICGVMRPEDARLAAQAGASAVGMVFAPSPRRLTLTQAKAVRDAIPEGILAFGVFGPGEDPDAVAGALDLDGVQLPADAGFAPQTKHVWRTVRVRDALDLRELTAVACTAVHIDSFVEGALGGTGQAAPWDVIAEFRPNVDFVIAGGLRPDNVAQAIRTLRPYGVDTSSGVESQPGIKDAAAVRAFVANAIAAQA